MRRFPVVTVAALAALVLTCSPSFPAQGHPHACARWDECRDLALGAAEAGEHERAHDLAWRAAQLGPARSPELMYLLARVQSLSGRPGDALVMLERLAAQGLATDADSHPDFARVRQVARWSEVEAAARGASRAITASGIGPRARETGEEASGASPASATGPSGASASPPAPGTAANSSPRRAGAPAAVFVEEALRLPGLSVVPGSVAYDGVSSRFLIGGTSERKIVVVNERSGRVDDLVRADSAGFRDIVAMAIDRARGDLWVISDDAPAGGEVGHGHGGPPGSGSAARLHKLQLVAGRPLATYTPPPLAQPARFTGLSLAPSGAVLVLDGAGSRLFRVVPGSGTIELAFAGPLDEPVAIAAGAGDRFVYVARHHGLSRVDLAQRWAAPVDANGFDVSGLERLWWHNGALLAVQATSEGHGRRLVRILLSTAGLAVRSLQVLDDQMPEGPRPLVGALWGDELIYVANATEPGIVPEDGAGGGAPALALRRARLR
jgi:hypothetical protein